MNHLILGGTGTVGSTVVKGLLERGEGVRVLTRSEARARALPEGAVGVVGDLTEPDTYGRIFTHFDTMLLIVGNVISELHEGLAALEEARRAGAKRIVYLSASHLENGRHIPHLAAKIAIEDAMKESALPFTILRPNNFYQNDYWYREALFDYGIYPQPIGEVGLSRVDVRDIGEAAVNALLDPAHGGKTYNLMGPEPLTGSCCARVYSEAMGREVVYAGNDLGAFAAQARQVLPSWMVWDFVAMYEMFQTKGTIATAQQLKQTETILGRAPRRFDDFAREMIGAAWAAA